MVQKSIDWKIAHPNWLLKTVCLDHSNFLHMPRGHLGAPFPPLVGNIDHAENSGSRYPCFGQGIWISTDIEINNFPHGQIFFWNLSIVNGGLRDLWRSFWSGPIIIQICFINYDFFFVCCNFRYLIYKELNRGTEYAKSPSCKNRNNHSFSILRAVLEF